MSTPDGTPYPNFRFVVEFHPEGSGDTVTGWFSEVTGLEATMEPKVVKEGGWNYGPVQLAGSVSFAPVILKRGFSDSRFLWNWFARLNVDGAYGHRFNVSILLRDFLDTDGDQFIVGAWNLTAAMPVKYRLGDLNAIAGGFAIEEVHLVHEGFAFDPDGVDF